MLNKCAGLLGSVGMGIFLFQPSTVWAQTVGPDLVIAMSHAGNFTVGENGVYTIVITNIGGTAFSGPMEVDDHLTSLPFTFVSATGSGWSCGLVEHGPPVGAVATCNSNSVIVAGATGSPITLTVLPTVSGTFTNTVGLSTESTPPSPTASDPTIVVAGVPTLPQWAVIVLSVLLALAGVAAFLRRTT